MDITVKTQDEAPIVVEKASNLFAEQRFSAYAETDFFKKMMKGDNK